MSVEASGVGGAPRSFCVRLYLRVSCRWKQYPTALNTDFEMKMVSIRPEFFGSGKGKIYNRGSKLNH